MNIPDYISGECGRIEFDYVKSRHNAYSEPSINNNADCAEHSTDNSSRLAVICHPHPVYGGTKDNKVVHTLCRAFNEQGIDCLRFNFRGVEQSEGQFDEGYGEYEDLVSVCQFVNAHYPIKHHILISGFSFGASIAIKGALNIPFEKSELLSRVNVEGLVLIAPPVRYSDFPLACHLNLPTLVVQGDADEVVLAEDVEQWLSPDACLVEKSRSHRIPIAEPFHLQCEVLEGASHFFHGRLVELKETVQVFLKRENLC